MKLELAEPKQFIDSISIINELVTEARFKITTDALNLVAMDPANVAMVIFKLLSSSFTEYDVKKDVDLTINLGSLKQVLRRVGSTDVLTLELDSDNRLKVEIRSKTKRTFYLPLIDIEEKKQKEPELSFPLMITTHSKVLNEAIEDAAVIDADSVSLSAEKDRIIIQAESDLSKAKIEIKGDDDTKITTDGADSISAKYSVEYLKKMITASKLSDVVEISFNTDYPLKLQYKVVDKLVMSFILAPRVDND